MERNRTSGYLHLQQDALPTAHNEIRRFKNIQGRRNLFPFLCLIETFAYLNLYSIQGFFQFFPETIVHISHLQGEIPDGSATFEIVLFKIGREPFETIPEFLNWGRPRITQIFIHLATD